jgi:RNA polymerase sigma factor (sigma-70 family)
LHGSGVEHGVMTPETQPDVGGSRRSDLGELYEREWAPLLRVAYLLTGSQSTAEEIVQDAFVRIQSTPTRVLNPAAYLRTSVANASRSVHRHRAVVERTPLPRPEPSLAAHDELFDALAKLPWRQQAALALRFHLDLPESEIAIALGCRPSTVRSITRRALAQLRKDLSA